MRLMGFDVSKETKKRERERENREKRKKEGGGGEEQKKEGEWKKREGGGENKTSFPFSFHTHTPHILPFPHRWLNKITNTHTHTLPPQDEQERAKHMCTHLGSK